MSPPLPRLRGRFEFLQFEAGRLSAVGWVLSPQTPIEEYRITLDGQELGNAEPMLREDVHANFPDLSPTPNLGFRMDFEVPAEAVEGLHRIETTGYAQGQPVGRITTAFARDFMDGIPIPPEDLMVLVANERNPVTYLCSAMEVLATLEDVFQQHGKSNLGRVLDWGCGVGRLSAFLPRYFQLADLTGCDIVSQNVEWCVQNLQFGTFHHIDLFPPLPWEAESFDTLIGYSVFTHLKRADQLAWLREIRRILKPGGLALVSVHGEFAATNCHGGSMLEALEPVGILDHFPDPNLDGHAPEGYYRAVFQTQDYTHRTWGEILDVADYQPAAMGHFQDLVVLKKPL